MTLRSAACRAARCWSGTIQREVIAAADLLAAAFGVAAGIWSCPGFAELAREGFAAQRWSMLHPAGPRRAS